MATKARAAGTEVVELPTIGDADPSITWRFAALLRRLRPDLVHIHSRRGADVWGGLGARLAEDLSKRYERIVLDCPPVLSELSAQVIRAADVVIVPLPPSPLSARALAMVTQEIRAHAKVQPPILPVLSMLDLRRNLHRAARGLGKTLWWGPFKIHFYGLRAPT